MRIKFLLWLIVIGLLTGIWRVGNVTLQKMLEEKLSQACQREVSIQSLRVTFRPGVELRGVKIAPAPDQKSAQPLSIGQVTGRVRLSSLLKARPIFLLDLPELVLTDRGIAPPVQWRIRNLHLQLRSMPQGYFSHARGELLGESGELLGQFEWSVGSSAGATEREHLAVMYAQPQHLAPYFMRLLGAAPIQGALHLDARITSAGDDLTAESDLTAEKLIFPTAEPTVLGPAGNELVGLLQDSQGRIHLNFLLKGKTTSHFDWSELVVVVLRESLSEGVVHSIQQTLASTQPIGTEH